MKFRTIGSLLLVLGTSFLAGIAFGHWQHGSSLLPTPAPKVSFAELCDDPSKIGSPVIDVPFPVHLYQAINIAEGDYAATMAAQAVVRRAHPGNQHIRNALMTLYYKVAVSRKILVGFVANCAHFGRDSTGVSAASQAYFDKPVSQITLAEAAMLAGLLKGPSIYDPNIRPRRAKQRRDLVLDQIFAHGRISKAELLSAKAKPVTTAKVEVQ